MATNRIQFLKKVGKPVSESYSIEEVARMAGISVSALREVYDRGLGAYSSNPGSVRLIDFSKSTNLTKFPKSKRLSAPQWAMARVYSFVNKGKTYSTADKDIAKKYNY
jgi:hypothetical protein